MMALHNLFEKPELICTMHLGVPQNSYECEQHTLVL